MPYQYDPANYDPNKKPTYAPIPVGDYRVRIDAAEWYTSAASGKESIKITFAVSGQSGKLWHYIGVSYDSPEKKRGVDQRVGEFLDAFRLPPSMNLGEWVGKTGGVHVKHKLFNGELSAKVGYILRREKVDALPAWQESGSAPAAPAPDPFAPNPPYPASFDISDMPPMPTDSDYRGATSYRDNNPFGNTMF